MRAGVAGCKMKLDPHRPVGQRRLVETFQSMLQADPPPILHEPLRDRDREYLESFMQVKEAARSPEIGEVPGKPVGGVPCVEDAVVAARILGEPERLLARAESD